MPLEELASDISYPSPKVLAIELMPMELIENALNSKLNSRPKIIYRKHFVIVNINILLDRL